MCLLLKTYHSSLSLFDWCASTLTRSCQGVPLLIPCRTDGSTESQSENVTIALFTDQLPVCLAGQTSLSALTWVWPLMRNKHSVGVFFSKCTKLSILYFHNSQRQFVMNTKSVWAAMPQTEIQLVHIRIYPPIFSPIFCICLSIYVQLWTP